MMHFFVIYYLNQMSENSYWRRRKKRTWYNDPFAFVLGGDMKDVET
jgi:hypothetical protein